MAGCWVKASGTSRLQSKWNELAFRTVDAYQKQKSLANNCHWSRISMDFSVPISAATATLSERRVKQNCICVCLSVLGLMVHCSNQCLPSFDFPCAYTSYMDVYSLFKSSWFSFAPLYVPISPSHTTYAACFRSVLYLGSWSYSIWFHVSSRKMIALDSTIV